MSFEEEMMSKDKDMSTYSFEPNRGYYLNHRNIFFVVIGTKRFTKGISQILPCFRRCIFEKITRNMKYLKKEYEISDGLQIFNVMSSDKFDGYLRLPP